MGDAGIVLSPEMASARANFDAIFGGFINDHVNANAANDDVMVDDGTASREKPASAKLLVHGMEGSASVTFGSGRTAGTAATDAAEEEDPPPPKRKRLGVRRPFQGRQDAARPCPAPPIGAASQRPGQERGMAQQGHQPQ